MARLKAGVLISGRGSNMAALIGACAAPAFPAEIALVLSNRADAAGLQRAAEAGVSTKVIPHTGWPSREDFDRAVSAALEEAGVELICLAGFMRLSTPWFVGHWRDRIINIHPSLLPAFKGLHPQRQALAAGVRFSGCSVHYVTDDLDGGPIIAQAAVPVHAGDDEKTLEARILRSEHRLYPMVLGWFGEGRVRLLRNQGMPDRVEIEGIDPDAWALSFA
jgi:phosphoribosylglycinamide formyltransferase-1